MLRTHMDPCSFFLSIWSSFTDSHQHHEDFIEKKIEINSLSVLFEVQS